MGLNHGGKEMNASRYVNTECPEGCSENISKVTVVLALSEHADEDNEYTKMI